MAQQHAVEDNGTATSTLIANGSGLTVMDLERALDGISGGAAGALSLAPGERGGGGGPGGGPIGKSSDIKDE